MIINDYLLKKIKENNFLIIGRAGADIYPDPPGTKIEDAINYVTHLGGSAANTAVELTKLGCKCKLLTRVSNDALGRFVIKQLNKYKIDSSLIKTETSDSRISFAIVETTSKDHQSIIYRDKASDLFMNKQDIIEANIKNFSCIIFSGTCLAAEPSRSSIFLALEIAKNNNIPVIQDIDYRPYTWHSKTEASEIYLKAAKLSDILIGNDYEFGILALDFKQGLNLAKSLKNEIDIVIYKKGENGSLTFLRDTEISKGIFKVNAIKPTGAGDAFMGGLIGSLVNDYSLEKSIEIGSAAAAIVVTKVGCSPAMPDLEEVLNFIKDIKMIEGEK